MGLEQDILAAKTVNFDMLERKLDDPPETVMYDPDDDWGVYLMEKGDSDRWIRTDYVVDTPRYTR